MGGKGDKNTNFFPAMASHRQRRNYLDSWVTNGVVVEEPVLIKEQVLIHFEKLFKENWE